MSRTMRWTALVVWVVAVTGYMTQRDKFPSTAEQAQVNAVIVDKTSPAMYNTEISAQRADISPVR
jgi:hypothetical protein